MMTLHWSPRSPFVRKAMIAIHEMGLQDQITCVRTVVAPTKVNEALRRDNPLSKLPALVADGSSLFDSRVILEYLDTLNGRAKLFPAAIQERFIALRNQALGDGIMDFALMWLIERQRGEGMQSEPLVAAFRVKLAASLARMEKDIRLLTERAFDVGQVTFGYLDFRFSGEPWRSRHPQLAVWHAVFVELLHANRKFSFRSTSETHDLARIAAHDRFLAVNAALEVDLTGQINAEAVGGRYVGAVGGAGDFLRGAARSKGGWPIVVLPSTAGHDDDKIVTRIVNRLNGPVSTARCDAGIIITEHGIADLRGLTLSARRDRMLAIAAPQFRQALDSARDTVLNSQG
ncbi:MAG: acetyl-CoA hydrolase/transferase C-terminal domain-containing protein [Terriglobales bacterium]